MELVGSWIPFSRCFNQVIGLENLIKLGYGKLAEGAEKLIVSCQEVLQDCGLESSYLSQPSKRWDDKLGWIDESENLLVFISGNSYVIICKIFF